MRAPGPTPRRGSEGEARASTIRRLDRLLAGLDLDCACRERLAEALTRFAELDERRARRERLLRARDERERIEGLLFLLAELHEIGVGERDTSVYQELERLFLDIGEAAARGAAAMRSAP